MLVSVIIPALNEAENIRACAAAARREYPPDAVEIIVVDGGSTDGTLDQIPADVTRIQGPRGRAVQMNRGAAAARGEVLVFCHADSRLPAGWREAVCETLSQRGVVGGTFQTLILPANWLWKIRNRWVFPTRWQIMFGDQAQFVRRETFIHVGGYPEIPLMEDVEMMRALHRFGRLARANSQIRVITSGRRFAERGTVRQIALNVWNMTRYLVFGATPERIARSYQSSRERETGEPH